MLRKTTIIVQAVELTKEQQSTLWSMDEETRELEHGVIDWDTDDGRNCIRLKGEEFWREVIPPKVHTSKNAVIWDLKCQDVNGEPDVDLCSKVNGGHVDIVHGKYGWSVLVLNQRLNTFDTRKEAIAYLENSDNIFEEPSAKCDHEFADTKFCVKCGWKP